MNHNNPVEQYDHTGHLCPDCVYGDARETCEITGKELSYCAQCLDFVAKNDSQGKAYTEQLRFD